MSSTWALLSSPFIPSDNTRVAEIVSNEGDERWSCAGVHMKLGWMELMVRENIRSEESILQEDTEGNILGKASHVAAVLIQPSLIYRSAFPCKQSMLKNVPCLQHICLSSVNFRCPGATQCSLAINQQQ